MPMADSNIATENVINVENLKCGADSDNVNDCINTSDFVELNVVNCDAMNVGFNFSKYGENFQGSFTNASWKFGVN